ncbi:LysM peptidoglycan-binding domain-containing protein [Salirhabdus salicampi]|uniref:LysM peptidoglycan-binding domain-containing protein n=1 Tax=Salirhabdus salicampi TaxID=476102 RepID=UPI0020C235A5|nr:LysM peptidoglycan-binding domain-containing protein [Salirhabdus salicampi]MCP8616284.1 LysM peptidoglycan-binding domain-containing protein [Salirhabdus salicampi]
MYPFTHYKLNETENGVEVILYLDDNMTEFADELGSQSEEGKQKLENQAIGYIRNMLPSIKVSTVKIMAGAMLVSSLGFGAIAPNTASAAEVKTTQQHTVSTGDTLYSLANKYDTTVDAIKKTNNMNSDFLRAGETLAIPSGTTPAPTETTTTHQVTQGDTLFSLAQKHNTTVDAIKKANNMNSDFLRVGQTLTIPSGTTSAPTETTTTHQVVQGDTLFSLAQKHNTTVDAIKEANNMNSNLLSVGQTLTIPSATTSAPTQTTTTHQVVQGDTLFSLAQKHNTTVDAIKKVNNMSSNFLRVGQTLTIPSGTSSTPTTSPAPATEQTTDLSQEDIEWLAKMIYSEARGESLEGQIAVGAVIMNRVESPLFPNTVKEVLFEQSNGVYQFTPAKTGSINTANPNGQNMEAAMRAANGEDPTNGSLYFYNPDKTNSQWLKSRTVSTVIGNHTFAF